MRGFRDRDFIQTIEGFYFCVIGALHPPKRVFSYIKYVPSKSGIWENGEEKFNRIFKKYTIPNLLETFMFLKQNYPQYLFFSPVNNITITAVPHQSIKEHFKPEQKLIQLKQAPELDSLQQKLIRLIHFLKKISGISEENFGVTGSILLDIHNPRFSDIDITIYGKKNSWILKNTLNSAKSGDSIKRLNGKALQNWVFKKTLYYPLTSADASKIYKRKWNLGIFENTSFSIHPIMLEHEITEKYGQKRYDPSGQITIRAVVSDNIDSLFLPAIYKIRDVNALKGKQNCLITEIITFETLYVSIFENGETIEAKGKLELVTEKESNRQHYRVVVGSAEGKGKEYIKLVD